MANPLVFTASAPAKVNLHLGVGEVRYDGYHDLMTVFQAVDQRETVRVIPVAGEPKVKRGQVVTGISTAWLLGGEAPENLDTPSNLAWRAVQEAVDAFWNACDYTGGISRIGLPKVRIEVDKRVFIAGGMAGGSADAAAALMAAGDMIDHFFKYPHPAIEVAKELGPELGADVPFSVMGGNAMGEGRGDELVPLPQTARFHWVFVNPATTINTGEAFGLLDEMRLVNPELTPHMETHAVTSALVAGDAQALGRAMHNDLELPALTMRPQIGKVVDFGNAEAVRAMVSGSGPTVAILCESADHAAAVLAAAGRAFPEYQAFATSGPAEGVRLD